MPYCVSCGTECLPKILVCPQCGARDFSNDRAKQTIDPAGTKANVAQTVTHHANVHGTQFTPAKNLPRFGAAVIDYLLMISITFIVGFVLQVLFDANIYDQRVMNLFTIVGAVVGILYFAVQHSGRSQATIGKRLLGLKICMADGGRVSFGLAIWRAIMPSIVSVAAIIGYLFSVGFAFGAIMAIFNLSDAAAGAVGILALLGFIILALLPHGIVFFNRDHKTLFDIICSTRVVEA